MTDEERIQQEYQDSLGRAATPDELSSDLANTQKYGFDTGQYGGVQATIANRATNLPGQGEHDNTAKTPSQAWNASAQTTGRSNSLYDELSKRIAGANAPVDPNDPLIHGQVATFGAAQERAKRDYLSNIAEKAGPLANLRGEQRMAAEKLGQNVSGFQSELLAREQAARRDQAGQALGLFSGQISGDQNRELQSALGFGDLNLRDKLGTRGLDQNMTQFLKELALRQWQLGDQSDYQWATL